MNVILSVFHCLFIVPYSLCCFFAWLGWVIYIYVFFLVGWVIVVLILLTFTSFSFTYTCSNFLSLLEYCFFGLPRDQRVFYLDLFIEILNIIFCVQNSLYKIEGIQYGILYFPTHVICIFSLLAR